MNDTVVNSVRKARESIFKSYNCNLKKLFEHEKESYLKIFNKRKMRGKTSRWSGKTWLCSSSAQT